MPRGRSSNKDVDTQESVEEKPVKKATRPGWKKTDELPKLKAKNGWHAKWASPSKLTRFRAEGWHIMKPSDNEGDDIVSHDVNNPGALSGELRYMDLVAIMLPPEGKKDRDEWLKGENREAISGIFKDTDNELKEHGVQTYTPRGQDGRIVIE